MALPSDRKTHYALHSTDETERVYVPLENATLARLLEVNERPPMMTARFDLTAEEMVEFCETTKD